MRIFRNIFRTNYDHIAKPIRSNLPCTSHLNIHVAVPSGGASAEDDRRSEDHLPTIFIRQEHQSLGTQNAWLSGYFNGIRKNTTIDVGLFRINKDKFENYCRMNQDTTLIDAAKKRVGIDK